MSRVSASCAMAIGAVTRRIGSLGKNTVPSGMAWTSPAKRSAASESRKAGLKRLVDASHSSSAGSKRSCSRNSRHCSSPAAIRKPRPDLSLRTKNSNTALSSMP